MNRGYTRAYMDRASAEDDAGPIRFIAATEGRKGDGIDLRMSGARLDRFRANPVVNYGHRYFSRQDLPIGRGTSTVVEGDRLVIDVMFDRGDSFAAEVERKYRDGFMNAVSIGFEVLQWEGNSGNYWTGGVGEVWELHELSAVPVPMDASAVVEAGRGEGGELEQLVRRELIRLLRSVPRIEPADHDDTEPGEQIPANPTRTESGVDEDAARDLLASIALSKENH